MCVCVCVCGVCVSIVQVQYKDNVISNRQVAFESEMSGEEVNL